LPAACGGGQNPRSCFTEQTGGQKFLSPKTPSFLPACFGASRGKFSAQSAEKII